MGELCGVNPHAAEATGCVPIADLPIRYPPSTCTALHPDFVFGGRLAGKFGYGRGGKRKEGMGGEEEKGGEAKVQRQMRKAYSEKKDSDTTPGYRVRGFLEILRFRKRRVPCAAFLTKWRKVWHCLVERIPCRCVQRVGLSARFLECSKYRWTFLTKLESKRGTNFLVPRSDRRLTSSCLLVFDCTIDRTHKFQKEAAMRLYGNLHLQSWR